MSAIWGMIDLKNEAHDKSIGIKMKEKYAAYAIDSYQSYDQENMVLGYGAQYFTKETKLEQYPIISNDGKLVFIGDVILDNREELLDKLEIAKHDRTCIPDGKIMFDIILKYGEQALSMFLGVYTFVLYNKTTNKVSMYTDSLGGRCLYYKYKDGKLWFSTLIAPIIAGSGEKNTWNDQWVADYLGLDSLNLFTNYEETPYKDIYKLGPGEGIIITLDKIHKHKYWMPIENIKINNQVTEKQVEQEFRKLYKRCVSSVLRSDKKTGILLSGGFDSSSVACLASPMLKEKEEMLYSYTYVPREGYTSDLSKGFIANESQSVKSTKQELGNISDSYISVPDSNGWIETPMIMEELELPYKALLNETWIMDACKKAREQDCRIMLSGQYGNTTVSFGSFNMYLYSLMKEGKLITLIKQINHMQKIRHSSRRRTYNYLFHVLIDNLTATSSRRMFDKVYINPSLITKYNMKKRFKELDLNDNEITFQKYRPYMAYKNALSQLGEYETKMSLITGVLLRDPTRDKRLIEFCLKLPIDKFVSNGYDKRLLRIHLKEELPSCLNRNYKFKGVQSADMIYRLKLDWPKITEQIKKIINTDAASKYLNIDKVNEFLQRNEKSIIDSEYEVNKLLSSVLIVSFLSNQEIKIKK